MDKEEIQKEPNDIGGLRLVEDPKDLRAFPSIEKQFINFIFFRVDPAYRKLGESEKATHKRDFEAVFDEYSSEFLLFNYSLVGFDSRADLMFWRIGRSMDQIQEMTAKLYRTDLGGFLETTDNYLAVTNKMMFVGEGGEDRYHVKAGTKRYHFLYPCAKDANWFDRSGEERDAMIEEHFMIGKTFPNIRIHLTHAFGFSDKEYLISFETDEPKDFLALAEELRQTASRKFTLPRMPVYTCRQRPLGECLDALG